MRMDSTGSYGNALCFKGFHIVNMNPKRYLGIWDSVNDGRVQLGHNIVRGIL